MVGVVPSFDGFDQVHTPGWATVSILTNLKAKEIFDHQVRNTKATSHLKKERCRYIEAEPAKRGQGRKEEGRLHHSSRLGLIG